MDKAPVGIVLSRQQIPGNKGANQTVWMFRKIVIKEMHRKRAISIYVPRHDKTNKMAVCPAKDSDQSGHLPSLIRVFAVHMKKPSVLSYPLSTL